MSSKTTTDLPPELLIMTFLELLGGSRANCSHESPLNQPLLWDNPALTISHVCKLWRSTSIGTPFLWASIRLTTRSHPDLAKLFLTRSKSAPLSIYVCLTQYLSLSDATRLCQLVAKEASRLRAIKICATGSLRSSSFLKGLERCEVPALRDLSLQALMGSVGSVLPLPSREIMVTNQLQRIQPSPFSKSGAPVRLRRLELRGMQVNLCAYSFSGLMSLSISWTSEDGKVTSAQFIELLQSSPILQDLSIDGGAIKSDELKPNFYATGARPSPASLPALTSLRVSSFNVPEQVANTLRLLRAPSLRVFRLRHMGNDLNNDGPTTDFDPLFDFLTGAGDHFGDFEYLQTLDVNCIELSSMNSFERFLCTLDNLKVFNVAYPESVAPPDDNMEDSCLRLFLSPSKRNNIGLPVLSSSLLCPNLKTIQASGISENALIDVVAARIEVGAPLRSLHCEEKLVEGVRDGLESRGMEPEVIAASAEEEPSKWHD